MGVYRKKALILVPRLTSNQVATYEYVMLVCDPVCYTHPRPHSTLLAVSEESLAFQPRKMIICVE
jgi:hypothetical protein